MAARAKKAQLEKIRVAALANAAHSAERQAALVETAEARKIRTAERKHSNRIEPPRIFRRAQCLSQAASGS